MDGPHVDVPDGAVIELRGVVKDFSVGLRGVKLRALDHVTLQMRRGQVYGLLGANGSGKSTVIKTILGLVEPTAGICLVFGAASTKIEARGRIGYVPETPQFYPYLTARELVRFHAKLAGLARAAVEARVIDALRTVELSEAADRRLATYSKGMLQRAAVAQAIVHDPELLVLDEPTTGLDPMARRRLLELISRWKAAGKTVVLSSHFLAEVEDACDRIAVLDRGRVVAEGSLAALRRETRRGLTVHALGSEHVAALAAWLAARGASVQGAVADGVQLEQLVIERANETRES